MRSKWIRDNQKRLCMYLINDIHLQVKSMADKRNITVTKWVSRAILRQLLQEKKYE